MRMSADQWSAVVDDMVGRGAEGTDDDFERIVTYLAAHFGNDKTDGNTAAQKVNVNTASAVELTAVLGLSKSDAGTIVKYRTDKGPYKDWADLRKVPDIDLKKLEDQKDRIAFTAPDPPAETHPK